MTDHLLRDVVLGCVATALEDDGDVSAGNVADIPVGTLRAVDTLPVAIGRDAMGLYAMTLTCTHAACDMATQGSVSASRVYCACHGSVFDKNGAVQRGPANSALVHFLVEIDMAGDITIRGGQQVDPNERTLVG